MADYYDWNKTLAYDADITMIVGPRGVGKTYGIRLQVIRDFIKKHYKFVEVVRFKAELTGVETGYFNRITSNEEFNGYYFKTDRHLAFIGTKDETDNKIHYEVAGYFIALSQAQQLKKRTFDSVKRIIFDEAVLDKNDRYHRYLPREFATLANIVDTVSRERPNVECIKPRLYLLGNALDVMNPYFMAYDVGVPTYGYSWHKSKTMLLHYLKDSEYSKEKANNTVAGRMLTGTIDGAIANDNEFAKINDDFIMKKTSQAKFAFGIIYDNKQYAIWEDWTNGYYFVNRKIPKNTPKPIYSITLDDNRMNYIAARKAENALRGFVELHYMGIIRYDTIEVRESFKEILNMFGVR